MTPSLHRFHQLDVFTTQALLGNPLAVVHGAQGLSDDRMAAFARWTNLSETTFLLPPTQPEADYRVRIFTPGGELPFAGHPTLGSCQAWLWAGGQAKQADVVVQECKVGLVRVKRDGTRLAFAAPPLKRSEVPAAQLQQVCQALGLTTEAVLAAQMLDNGTGWLALRLGSAAEVLALQPDHAALKVLPKIGVVGAQAAGHDAQFEVRGFAASVGVPEDPVTGSLNASLGQWLMGQGWAPSHYVAAQGTAMGRAGRVHLQRDGDVLWVGGAVAACIAGEVLV